MSDVKDIIVSSLGDSIVVSYNNHNDVKVISKDTASVEGSNGFVVIKDGDEEVLREKPSEFDTPSEKSLRELVIAIENIITNGGGTAVASTITVNGPAGNNTIKSVVESISGTSSSNRVVVRVAGGTYTEDTINVPNYVSIIGDGLSTVVIEASATNQNLLNLGNSCDVADLKLRNVGGTGIAINMSEQDSSDGGSIISSVFFENCSNGIYIANTTQTVFATMRLLRFASVTGYCIKASTGCNFTVFDTIGGALGNFLEADSTATLNVFSGRITSLNKGFVLSGSSKVRVSNFDMQQATTIPVEITGSTAYFQGFTNVYDEATISVEDLTTYTSFCGNTNVTDFGLTLTEEFAVGMPEKGKESVFGQGDSYTREMLVYSYNTSVYTDVSTEARSLTGSTFALPGTALNNALYFSSNLKTAGTSDYLKFLGLKVEVDTAGDYTGGDVVWEYWDGSSWTEFTVMFTKSGDDYLPLAKDNFATTGSYQVRFDQNILDDWTANDPISSGTNRFWVRFRVTSAITTAPVLEQTKLHTNRTELNDDGFLEYFGKARPINVMNWAVNSFQPALNSPANQDLYISDTIDIGYIENELQNGATDAVGFGTFLPMDCDTSTPIRLVIAGSSNNSSAGNIDWVIRWAYIDEGGGLYHSTTTAPTTATNQQSITQTLAAPTSAEQIKYYSWDLDISDIKPRIDSTTRFGGTIWISVQRTGGGGTDTHTGDFALALIQAQYLRWCSGGHV